MKNRLISKKQRKDFKLIHGYNYPEYRCNGKSTGEALEIIGEAMSHPGREVTIYDHYSLANETIKQKKNLIESLLNRLNLKYFNFTKDNCLKYDIYK